MSVTEMVSDENISSTRKKTYTSLSQQQHTASTIYIYNYAKTRRKYRLGRQFMGLKFGS